MVSMRPSARTTSGETWPPLTSSTCAPPLAEWVYRRTASVTYLSLATREQTKALTDWTASTSDIVAFSIFTCAWNIPCTMDARRAAGDPPPQTAGNKESEALGARGSASEDPPTPGTRQRPGPRRWEGQCA